MAEKQKNQIVVLEPVTKTVNELLEMITERDQAEIMPFMNADEAVQCTRQFVPCMFVICIQTNNDIPNVLSVLKKLKPDIKQGLVKTLLISKVKNPQLQKLIGEFGVTDYIEEPIPVRSLQFKANLQLRAVDTTRKQLELKKAADEKIVFKTSAKNGDDAAQTVSGEIKPRNKPALQLAGDTFLIKNGQVKKQAKKFVVELDGPDPSTGEWVPDGEDPATQSPNWRWQPHEKEDEPGAEEGDGWVATGDKPQFKTANRKWQLSAEKPSLFYKKRNGKIAEKIGVDENGELTVAEDSPVAEENLRRNLEKAERIRRRKAAEAAGLPPPEEEAAPEPAAPAPAPEEEEEAKGPEAILRALRKKKLAKAAGPGGAGEKAEEESGEESAEPGAAEPASGARRKLEELRRARKERRAGAADAGPAPAEETEEPPEPAAAQAEPEEEEAGAADPLRVRKRKKAKAEKPEAQVLDFLKKKKAAQAKAAPEGEAEATEPAEAEPGEETENSRLAALRKRARQKKITARGEGAEDEAGESAEAAAPEAPAEGADREEKPAEPAAAAPAPEEEESSGTEELLKRARERRRQREERKRELLEEIEAEESGAEPGEIETTGRRKPRKAAGEAPEEEESGPASERLEQLRRKRAELAALEAEAEAEERGEHLHTAQKDELRGMNVWDTDEEAAPDEGPAEKRLKKLKKDRAEKEAGEKAAGEAEADAPEEPEELARRARKKRKGSGASAGGAENASDGEEAGEAAAGAEAGAESAEEPEAPGESVSERLARLRKARDERNALLAAGAEESAEELAARAEPKGFEPEDDPEKSAAKAKAAAGDEAEKAGASATAHAGNEPGEPSADASGKTDGEEREEIPLDLGRAGKRSVHDTAEDLLAKKSKTSESMRKFLERRKQRKEVEQAEADASAGKPQPVEAGDEAAGERRSFLAIFVAVSDSFGAASDKRMANILRSLEGSLENCVAFFAEARRGDERFKVILGNSVDRGTELPADHCHVEDITGDGRLLGHLVLRMSPPRAGLAKDEADAVRRAMLTLRPLASQWLAARGEKAA